MRRSSFEPILRTFGPTLCQSYDSAFIYTSKNKYLFLCQNVGAGEMEKFSLDDVAGSHRGQTCGNTAMKKQSTER